MGEVWKGTGVCVLRTGLVAAGGSHFLTATSVIAAKLLRY